MPKTKFRILTSINGTDWRLQEKEVEASSREIACRSFEADFPDQSMTDRIVAIPARSWDPLMPTTETKTVTKFVKAGKPVGPAKVE